MKKKKIICFLAVFFLCYGMWTERDLLVFTLDKYLPGFVMFHTITENEKKDLNRTLECFGLETLHNNHFFSLRFMLFYEDGCKYNQIDEFSCKKENYEDCEFVRYRFQDGIKIEKHSAISSAKAKDFVTKVYATNVFEMQSIQQKSFFEYFDQIGHASLFQYRLIEISDNLSSNKFALISGFSKNKQYNTLVSLISKFQSQID